MFSGLHSKLAYWYYFLLSEIIDNIRHYGYETNKRPPGWFRAPFKIRKYFCMGEKILTLCHAITKAVTIRVLRVHTIANKE